MGLALAYVGRGYKTLWNRQPAARRRTSASRRVHEVTIVQRFGGRLSNNSLRPPRSTTPPRPSFRGAQLRDFPLVVRHRQVLPYGRNAGRPWACATTSSASNPRSSAHGSRPDSLRALNRSKRHPGRRAGPARDFDHRKVCPVLISNQLVSSHLVSNQPGAFRIESI